MQSLLEAITADGHHAFSFVDSGASLASGRSILDELKAFRHCMGDWEDNLFIQHIFKSEIKVLRESDAVILLEPAGHTSLAEADIAYGLNKQLILIDPIEHPEVMYRIFEGR